MRCSGAVEDGSWFCLAGVCFNLSGAMCVRVVCCVVLLTFSLIWRGLGLLGVCQSGIGVPCSVFPYLASFSACW